MFNSVKMWLKTPVVIFPFITYDGTGSPKYDEDGKIDAKCYAQETVQMVRDASGNEVVSDIQLYVEGGTAIKIQDKIIYHGTPYQIKTLGAYYDGNTGEIDIRVVYL